MERGQKRSKVPDAAAMRRQAASFRWKARERVARLKRMSIREAIREVEGLLGLDVPRRPSPRPEPPADRIRLG